MTRATTMTILLTSLLAANATAVDRPNVILIMTDDQGYGDLGCHGNPVLKTPHLDQLYHESVRLTDFHVSPFCTPTRAALMTGRYPARTGAYRTSSGRTMLHTDERTIANLFAEAGYVTGMVGKWHLGDNAPHRPQDRGFQNVVWHRCGGIGQASDYYGNDYFDDTYERNGTYEKFKGYCTDVWFAEAMRFAEENRTKPFFLYLATNAPHSPYRVAGKWSVPYKDTVKWKGGAEFYGMIANVDHNVGLLRGKLDELNLADNTILVFMTDNGTSNGIARSVVGPDDYKGFNADMRGVKSTVYEGGHRVPFFIHWPKGGLVGGRDMTNLSAHLDVLPTLAELCDVPLPIDVALDGQSFAEQLSRPDAEPHRNHVVVQLQGSARFSKPNEKWTTSCVIKDQWRLIDGETLFDLKKNPRQSVNVAARHPDKVKELRAHYETFWAGVSPRMTPVSIDLGNSADNPTVLCSQDWYMPTGNPPWNFSEINRLARVTGPWYVNVKKAGRYRLSLRQFPAEAHRDVVAVRAKVRIAGKEMGSRVQPGTQVIDFEMDLPSGKTKLETWLFDEHKKAGGAYFTEVELLSPAVSSAKSSKPSPPNIIFLFADDQRADTVGAHGNPHIQTPNLDRLAAEGFSFRRNYCAGSFSGAVCVASRAMLMTGRHWMNLPANKPQSNWGDATTLPTLLKSSGNYRSFIIGKWHNGKATLDRSFTNGRSIYMGGMANHADFQVQDLANGKLSPKRAAAGFSSEVFADEAVKFINNAGSDQPFFLYVAFMAPHDPRNPPEKYRQMYYGNRPPLPVNFLPQHPFQNAPQATSGRDESLAPWPRTREIISDQLCEYYGLVTHLDGQVGRVLQALKNSPHADNTLIVYTADHGLAMGSHGLLGKQNVYEQSMSCPLILKGPGVPKGKSSNAFTYVHDLYATICDFADVDTPDGVDSRNLTPVMNGQAKGIRDSLFLPFQDNQRAVRNSRWKLHVYPKINHRLLFDLSTDPHEITNLATDPAHMDHVETMMSLMESWRTRLGDPHPLRVDKPAPKEPTYDNSKRVLDIWQPKWIRDKYFDGRENPNHGKKPASSISSASEKKSK